MHQRMTPEMSTPATATAARGAMPATMPAYSYAAILAASERVQWRVEDLIGGDKRLDFGRPFMPASLARTEALDFLSPAERRTMNQVGGHTYLALFGVVEEFILPFVLDHARPRLSMEDEGVRAFLNFASEEAKHIHLFRRFRAAFEEGFGHRCDVIGPADAIAKEVLSHEPLSVALAILHIEWMTQRHYLESVKDDGDLDPMFKSLLRHHWMEEAQHAKLDTMMVEALAATMTGDEVMRAVDGYLGIGGFLDAGLRQQTELNLAALERALGRAMTPAQRERFMATQHQAARWTYLGSGMTHPAFLETLGRLAPAARAKVEAVAPMFC